MIISGFPCIGKSTIATDSLPAKIIDLESSIFCKGDFDSYVDMIKYLDDHKFIVLCSSHRKVREKMLERNIPYTFVHPSKEDKEIYVVRATERQPHPLNPKTLEDNWDTYLQILPKEDDYTLGHDEYLSYETLLTLLIYKDNDNMKFEP